MSESRQELVSWLNQLLQLNVTRVEQCGTGAAFCQIFDSIFLDVPMSRVKFSVITEYAYIANFKILQNCFAAHGINRPVPVESLVKCKMQDNLEFLQWAKRYWDQNYPGGEYDAVARRKGSGTPALHTGPPRTAVSHGAKRGITPTSSARTKTPLGGGGNSSALQAELTLARETATGLERERDFYFSKLRDIELLIQQEVDNDPSLEKNEDGIYKRIQSILYSTEEGFEIPPEDAAAEDLETF